MASALPMAALLRRRRIERRLRRFIADHLLEHPSQAEDPLAAGEVDSLGQEQLVAYIEEEYGVYLDDADLAAENFRDVPTLAAFVEVRI